MVNKKIVNRQAEYCSPFCSILELDVKDTLLAGSDYGVAGAPGEDFADGGEFNL